MSSADMTSASLPSSCDTPDSQDVPDAPELDEGVHRGRRNRRRWYWCIGALLALGAVLGAAFVPTPYVLIQPGAVRPAEDRVVVEGTESYPNEGSVLFTTVFVDDATLFGLARGALDDAVEVRSSEEVYGDRGRDETRRVNRREMDLSKLIAEREALTYLGYEAEFAADGVSVVEIAEDVPAAEELEPGDVIVSVNGEAVTVPDELRAALAPYSPGDTVTLGVKRSSVAAGESAASGADETASLTLEVGLTAAEDDPATDPQDPEHQDARAVLGVVVEPYNPRIDSEVDVRIDSGEVTGPSAGLAWALAIIDVVTPESLTGDRDVAVTGEILADGSVGVIGGTAQKTATVVRNGVDVFMYPADTPAEEQAEMRAIAGDDTELVPVATLQEAVEYLVPGGVTAD